MTNFMLSFSETQYFVKVYPGTYDNDNPITAFWYIGQVCDPYDEKFPKIFVGEFL
jgi:hypothetical protein